MVTGQIKGRAILSVLLLGSVVLSGPAWAAQKSLGYRAANHWDVDGQHGVLRVNGSLTDSPCRLAMESQDQSIALGTVALGDLPHIGSQGRKVTFRIGLTDCLAVANGRGDRQTGLIPWSQSQPGVAIRFMAPDTDGRGRYAQLRGVSGLGLEIRDAKGNALTLGQYGVPQLLPMGQTSLTYTVAPVRLASWVSPGAFYAIIGFQLSYD